MNLGQRIKALRLSRGWSEERFASACRLAPEAVRQYEEGTRTPSVATIIKVCQALEVSANALLNLKEPERPPEEPRQLDLRWDRLTDEHGMAILCPECGEQAECILGLDITECSIEEGRQAEGLVAPDSFIPVPKHAAVRVECRCMAGHPFYLRFAQGFVSRLELHAYRSPFIARLAPTVLEGKFKPGDRVRHTTWGAGTVTRSVISDGGERVTVHFPRHGLKSNLFAHDKLTKLD